MTCAGCSVVEILEQGEQFCYVCSAMLGIQQQGLCTECGCTLEKPAGTIDGKSYCNVCYSMYQAIKPQITALGFFGYARPLEDPSAHQE